MAEPKSINLALQGGGSHGAYAWGILDYLLEDGRLKIEGICATSAGTMNAIALASGYQAGGAEKAREVLHDFWRGVHEEGQRYSLPSLPFFDRLQESAARAAGTHTLQYYMLDSVSRLLSPYQFNPFDINPLRTVLERTICFKTLRACDAIKLFISATHVRTGKVRVFQAAQMDIDVAMASACLPFLFKAVTIKGEPYWDGGYMGNPALYPLFYETQSRDVLIVHINPIEREGLPKTGPDIMNRINEISFNASLLNEMRAIAFVKKLIEHDMLKPAYKDKFKDVLVHSIRADKTMKEMSVASKFNTDWDFLTRLRDKGRETAKTWLDQHFDDVGSRDTVDLHSEFLYSVSRMFEN